MSSTVVHQISKSDYLKFRIHPAYLWYQKNAKHKLPKPTANDEYVFEQGHVFEELAQGIFEAAHSVEAKPWEYDKLLAQTQHFMEEANVKTIFQASFMTDDRLFCRSDVIERVDDGWILSEVKSSTSVKQSHIYDVAFQKMVMERLGHRVVGCRVIHVNKYYRRKTEVKPESITAIRDITEQVDEVMAVVERETKEAQAIPELHEVDDHPAKAGDLNAWMPIYTHLHEVPQDSVLNFVQLKPQQLRGFYAQGVEKIQDVAPSSLNEKQLRQQEAWLVDKPIVDTGKITKFVESLEYPLYFLDYETSAYVIPFYEGTKPYQQVPFQYSLHVQRSPGAELEHYEYLHSELSLPAHTLSKKLLDEIGTSGTVLAWFDKFEKYCNRTMADLAPQHKEGLIAINDRLTDLRIPFANYGYVHKLFNGSTSIKNVMPVLIPDLSYKELDISEGGAAQRLWQQVVTGEKADEKDQTFDNLLEYCKLDTLAMVEIFQFLLQVIDGEQVQTKQRFQQGEMF